MLGFAIFSDRTCVQDNFLNIMGNAGVRLGDVGEIRDRQEWRQAFDAADLETFERIAGPLNRGFGYE